MTSETNFLIDLTTKKDLEMLHIYGSGIEGGNNHSLSSTGLKRLMKIKAVEVEQLNLLWLKKQSDFDVG